MAADQIALAVFLNIFSISLGILLTKYALKFHNLRNEMIVIKRRGNLVTAISICAIIILLFAYPVRLIYWELQMNLHSTFYIFLDDLIFNPLYYITMLLLLLRHWLIYYDIKFSSSLLNLEWKRCIHSDIKSLKQEIWYIQHRQNFDNTPFMTKRIIFIGGTIAILSMSTVFLFEFDVIPYQFWHIINGILFPFILISLVLISQRMPTFNDNIYLHKESKLILFFGITTFLCYAICIIIGLITGRHMITHFLVEISGMTAIFTMPFISTFWVLKQIQLSQKNSMADDVSLHIPDDKILKLNHILADGKLMNLFMQHLIEEFSMECLLAVIEIEQYKKCLIEKLQLNTGTNVVDIPENVNVFEFSKNVPLSDIVYNDNDEKETGNNTLLLFKIKAHKLYTKYVKSGSEFELNTSYRTRGILDHLMGNYDVWISDPDEHPHSVNLTDLLQLFLAAENEMIALLNHSTYRFKYETV